MLAHRKESKEDVFYTIVPTPDGKTCGDSRRCQFFEAVPGAHGDGICQRVNGIISRMACCDLWQEDDPLSHKKTALRRKEK